MSARVRPTAPYTRPVAMSLLSWLRWILIWESAGTRAGQSQRANDLELQASNIALAQVVAGSLFILGAALQLSGRLDVAAGVALGASLVAPNLLARSARRLADGFVGLPLVTAWTVYSVRLLWLLGSVGPSLWILKH